MYNTLENFYHSEMKKFFVWNLIDQKALIWKKYKKNHLSPPILWMCQFVNENSMGKFSLK